jgi:hypothetical protein
MQKEIFVGRAIRLILFLAVGIIVPAGSYAHDPNAAVYWHLNPNIESCSIELDPALTQSEFRKFSRQAGLIGGSRAMASAETLGKGNFSVGLEYSNTPVNQRDNAWINTFTHPDADCPLGDSIKIPLLRVKYGIKDNMDLGAAVIKTPEANYGFLSGEFKYSFLKELEKTPAAAFRTAVTTLLGVADMDMNILTLDCSISKKVYGITPHLGLRENLIMAKENTSKVDLSSESLWQAQGYIGIEYKTKKFGFAVEYNIAEVKTAGILISYVFRS